MPFRHVAVTGGISQNPVLMQLLSDILGRKIRVAQENGLETIETLVLIEGLEIDLSYRVFRPNLSEYKKLNQQYILFKKVLVGASLESEKDS